MRLPDAVLALLLTTASSFLLATCFFFGGVLPPSKSMMSPQPVVATRATSTITPTRNFPTILDLLTVATQVAPTFPSTPLRQCEAARSGCLALSQHRTVYMLVGKEACFMQTLSHQRLPIGRGAVHSLRL